MTELRLAFHRMTNLFFKAIFTFYYLITPLILIYIIYNYVTWLGSINDVITNILVFFNIILIIMNIIFTMELFFYIMDSISESQLKIKMLIDGIIMLLNIIYFIFFNFYVESIKIYSISLYIISVFLLIWTILVYNSKFLHILYCQGEPEANPNLEKEQGVDFMV